MILTQLPDLAPRPETPRNASFRREFYRRWGQENSIVCGSAQHAEYATWRQTLSIKSVCAGREHYFVDGRRLTVTDETWLVLNEGREYGSVLEAPGAAFSFCIFFRPRMGAEMFGASRLDASRALDAGPQIDAGAVEFDERLRPHDRLVSPALNFIRGCVRLGVDDPGWCEEQFSFLLERLIRGERDAARLPERIDCVRAATRAELMKRLGWATDFMHSNLQRQIALADIANAARLSSYHFLRLFRQVYGVTPMSYLRTQRMRRALALLSNTQLGINEVAEQVGLTRLSLWRHVRAARGEPPQRIRQRGESSCAA